MTAWAMPWWFELERRRVLRDRRGSWRTMLLLEKLGALDRNVACRCAGADLLVPLNWRWLWQNPSVADYEPTTIDSFLKLANASGHDEAVFFDCGAHIGLFSHQVANRCPGLTHGWAFEPHPQRLAVLRSNCARLPVPFAAVGKAVGRRTGHGVLRETADGDCDYMEVDETGGTEVTCIDDLHVPRGAGVLLKVDVEGFERAVLEGASQTLKRARWFVVLFEAHADVQRRTGEEPMDCIRALQACGATHWALSTDPQHSFSLDRPFFSQFPERPKRDILAWKN